MGNKTQKINTTFAVSDSQNYLVSHIETKTYQV